MKEVYLKCDMIPYEKRSVNALIDRLYTITQSNYGVLSGNVIWFELLDRLGVESEKEILDAFGINDLKSKIYNITNIGLCQDIESMCAYLMFKIDDSVKCGTECVAITGLGIHFDSVKDKLGFSISVEKKELDNAADMRMPIKNTIDIAIKKVTE